VGEWLGAAEGVKVGAAESIIDGDAEGAEVEISVGNGVGNSTANDQGAENAEYDKLGCEKDDESTEYPEYDLLPWGNDNGAENAEYAECEKLE